MLFETTLFQTLFTGALVVIGLAQLHTAWRFPPLRGVGPVPAEWRHARRAWWAGFVALAATAAVSAMG